MAENFTIRTRAIIRRIPPGMVTTYGIIAGYAGNSNGARQVARILHSSSKKYGLPWHRVVNRNGHVSERSTMEHIVQRQLLEEEGVSFGDNGKIDFTRFLWLPEHHRLDGVVKTLLLVRRMRSCKILPPVFFAVTPFCAL